MLRRLSAVALAAAAFAPVAALAGPSELQEGSFTVPYACSVSPVSAALSPGATSAVGGGTNAYSQNSATQYSLSPLAIAGPLGVNNAAYSGAIAFNDANGTVLVANSSTTTTATGGTQAALSAGAGSTGISMATSEAGWRAGNYSVASTLSCAQVES